MGNELALQTKVGKVLLDFLSDQRSHQTEALGFLGVEGDDLLFETTTDEVVSWQPDVLGRLQTDISEMKRP